MSYTLDENQFDPLPDLWELVSSENASGFEISLLAAAPSPVMEEPDGLTIIGGLGDEVSDGSSDGDTLLGGEGNAVHFVDDAGNLNAFGREELLDTKGSDGNDTLEGSKCNDSIIGLGGRDCLIGLGGDDRLQGCGGGDTLVGGEGKDVFDYGSIGYGNKDGTTVILDYEDGVDKICGGFRDVYLPPNLWRNFLTPPISITQEGPDTVIVMNKDHWCGTPPMNMSFEVRLVGVDKSLIEDSDFVITIY